MKRLIKLIFPLLLAAVIVTSIGWYLLEYDPAFTRDLMLRHARMLESNGNFSAAIWLYNLAYDWDDSDEVAIELAEQFKSIGNYSKAEYTLRKAIEDGGSVDLYIALSKTYIEQGKLRDAVFMLENAGGDIKAALDELRPAAPEASLPSGSYHQYLSVELTAHGSTIYVATDHDYPSATTDRYTGPIALANGETTLFAVSVGENGLVSSLAVYNYIVSDVVESVTFQDAGFEAAVRQKLGYNSSRVIYSDALWSITELTLPETVGSCGDLRWFTGLKSLTIDGATLDDASAIGSCTALQNLFIRNAILSTDVLQSIGTLKGLQTLTLKECNISSISFLSGLTELTELDLSSNAIRDITALSQLSKLTQLNLSSNALISLSGLENLTLLTSLDVSFNSIVSTAPLASMHALLELDISSNALRSLDSIGNLVQLTQLRAAHNELLDLDALANCQALVYLDVSHNTLLRIDTAASLVALEEFDFSYNEVKELPAFDANCALRILNGAYNQLSSLKKLSGLKNLTHVYMNYNAELSSVSPLTSCSALKEVYVYGTKVRNVTALTALGVLVVYSPV